MSLVITRRHALGLTLQGVAALLASAPHLAGCGARVVGGGAGALPEEEPLLTWMGFVEALSSMAQAQFSPDWNQDEYVKDVIALMGRLNRDDAKFESFYDDYVNAKGLFPEIASVHQGGHFAVATLEFNAGDRIRLHNHPDMTGVILCLKGSIDVEAFDLLNQKSAAGHLLLEQVFRGRLQSGEYATLTAKRGNVHGLIAQEYTELLDVFTPPYDSERLKQYRWYRRAESPIEHGGRVFEAWEI